MLRSLWFSAAHFIHGKDPVYIGDKLIQAADKGQQDVCEFLLEKYGSQIKPAQILAARRSCSHSFDLQLANLLTSFFRDRYGEPLRTGMVKDTQPKPLDPAKLDMCFEGPSKYQDVEYLVIQHPASGKALTLSAFKDEHYIYVSSSADRSYALSDLYLEDRLEHPCSDKLLHPEHKAAFDVLMDLDPRIIVTQESLARVAYFLNTGDVKPAMQDAKPSYDMH